MYMYLYTRGWELRKKGKKQKLFLVLSPRPRPDGPNASGWYRRLREPISSLSLLNCGQLWQLFSRGWTILHSTITHDLDSRITAKYSKCQTCFYSMQVSFRFHSLRCSEILVSPSICTKIRTWRFHRTEEISKKFTISWHITHISMAISANLARDTDHNSTKLVCSHPLIYTQGWGKISATMDYRARVSSQAKTHRLSGFDRIHGFFDF